MNGFFHISGDPESPLKIKSFSSTTRGEKATIRLEIDITDLSWLGYTLKELAEVQKEQRRKPKPAPKAKPAKQKMLALPAPQLALPAPEDRS